MSTHGGDLKAYVLGDRIGRGAAGSVYIAQHMDTGQEVAIKLLRPQHLEREELRERFRREARLASQLRHPNIAPVIDYGVDGEVGFLAMKYIKGRSLADRVDAHGALSVDEAVDHALLVLDALAYAHRQRIVHRDVKAENVICSEDGQTYLVDFGLARELDNEDARLTQDGVPMGTPFYMSPEQWRVRGVDERTDLFSAGVLLYFMLTARFPFEGANAAVISYTVLSGQAPEPLNRPGGPTIPESIVRVVLDALQPDVAHRIESAETFAARLRAWSEPRHHQGGFRARPRSTPRNMLMDLTNTPPSRTPPLRTMARSSGEHASVPAPSSLERPAPPAAPQAPASPPPSTPTRPTMSDTTAATNEAVSPQARQLALHPVEIAEGTYWVGKRQPRELFYANPYLRSFKGRDTRSGEQTAFHLLLDPGSSSDFGVVQAKCSRLLGDLGKLSAIFINHQDPDVSSSAGVLLGRYTPKAHVLCTEDTWRLVQHYNIPKKRFVPLERYPNGFELPTGDLLRPVPSPFCHFVGATMLYDPQTRVLFTGDLFGGLTSRDAEGLYADESDWIGMRAFHQIYMPTNAALRHAIANIRAIGDVVMIAPQHGRVIRGELINEFMTRLEQLPVGLDIMADRQATPDQLRAWTSVLNRGLSVASSLTEHDLVALLEADPNLQGIVQSAGGGEVEITSLGKFAVERALRVLCEVLDADLAGTVKYEIIFATQELGLPTPVMEIDDEGGVSGNGSMLGSLF